MELGAPGLETSLLKLEPLAEDHREAMAASSAVNDMWQLMPIIPNGNTIDAYFDHTLKMSELGTGQGMAIILKSTQKLVGMAAYILPNRLHRRVRIGYTWLEVSQRGTGVSKHVQYLMVKRAMQWRARRVEWLMSVRSGRAIAHLDRSGAHREGVLRKYSRMADGSWADVVVYSLVDDEIRTVLDRLGQEIGESATAPGT